MSRAAWWLAGLLVGTNVVLVQQAVMAKSPQEIARIAKAITVAIKVVGTTEVGSGILLQKQGEVYTVLTAGHVVNKPGGSFTIKTVDGQVHQAIAGSVRLPGSKLDLAVLKFQSKNNYTLVKIGTSNTLAELSPVYVAGFPAESTSNKEVVIEGGTFIVTEGKVTGKGAKGNEKGYSLIYSNTTKPGMSGGPVLNEAGELVAIHGQGDREDDGKGAKTGLNLGIVVERFGTVEMALGVRTEQPIATLPPSTQLNAADYIVRGSDKYFQRDFPGALADYNQAIALDPKNSYAYDKRAGLREQMRDLQGALTDYNQLIALEPKNSRAYFARGLLKQDLKDYPGALADYNQGIVLEPKIFGAYLTRSTLKEKLKDYPGALADLNQMIALKPKDFYPYLRRSELKYQKLNDDQGAVADLSKIIEIEPKFSGGYYYRGNLFYSSGNVSAAIKDFRQVVAIDPSGVYGLIAKGIIQTQHGSYPSAITNFNKAAQINPNSEDIYKYRGVAHQKRGNRAAAIADWRKAAQTYKNNNQPKDYKMLQSWLQKIGASE
jgi:tetratricopeptide (TPR) repeat protein